MVCFGCVWLIRPSHGIRSNLARRVADFDPTSGTSMTMPKRNVPRETWWVLGLAGTITLCSGYPASVPDVRWLAIDKVGHFIAYGSLATAMVRHPALVGTYKSGGSPSRPGGKGWWAVVFASAYGLGDEFRQSLTAGVRQYDLADWGADTVGALVAVALYLRWSGYRRLMEAPLWKARTGHSPSKPATGIGH